MPSSSSEKNQVEISLSKDQFSVNMDGELVVKKAEVAELVKAVQMQQARSRPESPGEQARIKITIEL